MKGQTGGSRRKMSKLQDQEGMGTNLTDRSVASVHWNYQRWPKKTLVFQFSNTVKKDQRILFYMVRRGEPPELIQSLLAPITSE